jgi:hypothetical protein
MSRLTILKLESLEKRRLQADLIFAYKMLFGLIDMCSTDYFTINSSNFRETRENNPYKMHVTYCRVDIRKYFYSRRIEAVWNSIIADELDFKTLASFKRVLRRTDFSKFLNV